jgi:hypothetical protein
VSCSCEIPLSWHLWIFGSVISSSLSALVSQVHISEDIGEYVSMFDATVRVDSV